MSVTDTAGKEVKYRWGSMGEKLSMVYSDGKESEYRYNRNGQLKEMILPTGTVTYEYDGAGRLVAKNLPNGITTSYAYNELNRISEIRHEGNGVSEFYRYEYDSAGNKISAEKNRPGHSEDNGIFSYGYDALNQLVSVSRDGSVLREYGYDSYGNRVRKTEHRAGSIEETLYKYNLKDQLTEEIREGSSRVYGYDRRGNLREVSSAEGIIRKYTFDARNILSEVTDYTNGQISTATYGYNGLGNRVSQSVKLPESPEKSIHYTLDLTRKYYNLLEETTAEGSSSYYWDGNVVGVEKKDSSAFYIQDDLGSPMGIYDAEAELKEINGYDEFGLELANDNVIHAENRFGADRYQAFGFTGYQLEAVGGLYYAQARRYDAGAGRFVSEDKVRGFVDAPYTLNHYGYCWNNPSDKVDLNGMYPELPKVDIGANLEAFGTDSALISDVSAGTSVSLGGMEAWVGSEAFRAAEIASQPSYVGAGQAAKNVTANITRYQKVLNGGSKIANGISYAGVVVDVGSGVYNNVQNGASTTKIVSDATVDTAVDVLSVMISMAAADAAVGAVAGSVAPGVGTLIGAVAGAVVGIGVYVATDVITINGKSFRDWFKEQNEKLFTEIGNELTMLGNDIKEGVTAVGSKVANTVSGWFSKDESGMCVMAS